jgi:hypothetical protein
MVGGTGDGESLRLCVEEMVSAKGDTAIPEATGRVGLLIPCVGCNCALEHAVNANNIVKKIKGYSFFRSFLIVYSISDQGF